MPRRLFRNHLSPEEMNRGVGMLESGVFQRRVAGILNVSQSVIFWLWNRHLTHRDSSHRHGGGRDRTSTRRQGRLLLIQSRRQRFHNATSLNNEFRNETGVRISTQTVINRLHEFGFNARRPAKRVPLTRQHVQDWLELTRIRARRTIRDWTPVLFTDESRLCRFYWEASVGVENAQREISSLIARRWVGLQTLWWFRLKDISIDEMVGAWCFGCLSGPPGFTCWISFAPVYSLIYCWVLILALSPCYILIYMF